MKLIKGTIMDKDKRFKNYCKNCGELIYRSTNGRLPIRCSRCARLWAYKMKKAEEKIKGEVR